jgi:hypothetical protein
MKTIVKVGNVMVSVKMSLLKAVKKNFFFFALGRLNLGANEKLVFENDYVQFGKNSVIHDEMCVIRTANTGNNSCGQRSVITGSEARLS